VTDIDDFIGRLWAKDYYVTTSSGTGGKLSMVPKSKFDMAFTKEYVLGWRHLERRIKRRTSSIISISDRRRARIPRPIPRLSMRKDLPVRIRATS
jgi:hypothetical protein